MNVTWVLLIFLWSAGNNGVAIDKIEGFTSLDTCEIAAKRLDFDSFSGKRFVPADPRGIKTVCVPKQ